MMRPQQRDWGADLSRRVMAGLRLLGAVAVLGLAVAGFFYFGRQQHPGSATAPVRTFKAKGTVQKVELEQRTLLVEHGAIPSYMDAMTMPFKVRRPEEMTGLEPGDQISFQLCVTETESWIDRIVKMGRGGVVQPARLEPTGQMPETIQPHHPLLDYPFTNELGQAVTLHSFKGQALAMTFFFTRCPIPEFCPRLSKNFAEASGKLSALPHAPTNWHFLSVSFDPAFDTPGVLKAYAQRYHYDPAHWSFLTGPKDKIGELARLSNVEYEPDSGLFNHNFRTMIIDASGRLQMVFPIGGDLSDEIVSEVLKAAAAGKHKPS